MIFRIFRTELSRSLLLSIVLFASAFVTGYAATSAVVLKTYIEKLFAPVAWDADLIILPKGVSLDDLHRSLVDGEPAGLIPQALLATLDDQVQSEATRLHLSKPSLEILGFVPIKKDGQAQVAYLGNTSSFFQNSTATSVWSHLSSTPWSAETARFNENPLYRTTEWGSKVLMGVLARGDTTAIQNLKTLIDRRTVAQAWVVKTGESKSDLRQTTLSDALTGLTTLILVALIPALILSFLILRERRKTIENVLHEIGAKASTARQVALLQLLSLVIIPIFLGVALSAVTAPLLKSLLG